jgi:hypothetical protein
MVSNYAQLSGQWSYHRPRPPALRPEEAARARAPARQADGRLPPRLQRVPNPDGRRAAHLRAGRPPEETRCHRSRRARPPPPSPHRPRPSPTPNTRSSPKPRPNPRRGPDTTRSNPLQPSRPPNHRRPSPPNRNPPPRFPSPPTATSASIPHPPACPIPNVPAHEATAPEPELEIETLHG